jgi:hypothetical protein
MFSKPIDCHFPFSPPPLEHRLANIYPLDLANPQTGGDDVFLQSTNANYIDEMYAAWKQDPSSVHVSWQVSACVFLAR